VPSVALYTPSPDSKLAYASALDTPATVFHVIGSVIAVPGMRLAPSQHSPRPTPLPLLYSSGGWQREIVGLRTHCCCGERVGAAEGDAARSRAAEAVVTCTGADTDVKRFMASAIVVSQSLSGPPPPPAERE